MDSGKREVLAYRLDEETEELLNETITANKYKIFLEISNSIEANYKTINVIKKLIKKLSRSDQLEWGRKMVRQERPIHKVLGAYLLEQVNFYVNHQDEIIEIIENFSSDEDWNVRQSGVDLFEALTTHDDNYKIDMISKYLHSDDVHLRRLAILTVKSIVKSASYPDTFKEEILDHLEGVLAEDDPYVQTVSNDMFKEGYMKYCTEITLNWLSKKAEDSDDPRKISTILNVIGTRNIDENIEQALKIIDALLDFDDEIVKKARSNALHVLSENHHDRIASFLESRLHIKQAVDHWSELEADGTLNSFEF